MQKFSIIEEGRLSKSQMTELIGGREIVNILLCKNTIDTVRTYTTIDNCSPAFSSYSMCPGGYMSCNESSLLTCVVTYIGQTGPNG